MGETLNGILGTKIGLPKFARRCAERPRLSRETQLSSVFSDGYHGMPLEVIPHDQGSSVHTGNDQVSLWDSTIQHWGIGPSGVVFAV